jgi:hypothetical protein
MWRADHSNPTLISSGAAVAWGYERRSRPTARFWLSRSERSNLLLLGLVGAKTRFHASTRISATRPMHLVCAAGRGAPSTPTEGADAGRARGEEEGHDPSAGQTPALMCSRCSVSPR